VTYYRGVTDNFWCVSGGIDACGVGFETCPDGCAVGRDLSERGKRDLSERAAKPPPPPRRAPPSTSTTRRRTAPSVPWAGLGCECGCYSCWGWGIDAFGVGFETRPDGCAVGRDLSERCRRDLSE